MTAQDIETAAAAEDQLEQTGEMEETGTPEETTEHAMFRIKPDGDTDPAGEAGWYLQRERERRGLSLEDAGEATGVHPYHIEAIEYGDLTRMPERREALEMVALYAQFLEFDPQPLIAHYDAFLPLPEVAAEEAHPADPLPLSSAKILKFGKMPKMPKINIRIPAMPGGTGGIVASVAGAIMLFAGASWLMMPGGETAPQQNVAAVETPAEEIPVNEQEPTEQATAEIASDDQIATSSTDEQAADITVKEEPMADDQLAALAETEAAQGNSSEGSNLEGLGDFITQQVPDEKPAEEPQNVASIQSADDMIQTPEGRTFGIKNGDTRLVLKAKAPVWVRIEDASGNVVMTQMLMQGDTYRVPDRDGLVVIARDGGLLSYLIDGQEKGILGTPGEILVGRPLDIKALEGQG
ncbi:MAG: helix-turn-helix domain-containing protein [Aestuariivirga sp.]